MKFAVRYWSALLSHEFRNSDGSPKLVDYSTHPATKIGLHNALLSLHDRIEVLETHCAPYECAVFLVDGDSAERLTDLMTNDLFKLLPNGDVKWIDIHECMLPKRRKDDQASINKQQLQLNVNPVTGSFHTFQGFFLPLM